MRTAVILATLASLWMAAPASAQQDGVTLQPARLPGMCLTMTGAAIEAVSLPCIGHAAEKFTVPGPEGGPIRFTDKCLAPRGDGNYPPLVAVACDGSPEQTWKQGAEGELRSAAGRCISLLGASSRTGEMIFAGECPREGEGQAWAVRKVDFTNVVEASLESLARPGQCIGYDTGLALYPCTDAYRQVMSFDEKAVTQLRMMSSCLSGGFVFGALRLGECWDDGAQKWVFLEGGRIANISLACIEVSNEEGRDVLRTKACSQAPEQTWRVRKPPAVEPVPAPPADIEAPATPEPAPPEPATSETVVPGPAAPEPAVLEPAATTPAEALADPVVTTPAAEPVAAAPAEAPADPIVTATAAEPVAPVLEAPAAPVAETSPSPALPAAPQAPPIHLVTTLQHEQLPGMCMSLSGRDGETESRPCDGSEIQAFQFPGAEPGSIRNGDRCLAPRGKGMYPQLVAEICDGTPIQTWTVTPEGEVRNVAGRCLALLGTSSRSGERIYAGECPAGLPAHRWRMVAVDPAMLHPASGMIEAVSRPGKCLGTDGALGIVDCAARLGRVFSFDFSAPGQLRIMSNCLAGGYVFETLALGQCWDLPAQKWSLTPTSNLMNLEGECLSVAIDGGRDVLRTATCQPVPEQQWTVKNVQP